MIPMDNIGLVEYAKKWLEYNTRYGWGCWGQPISGSIIASKSMQYPDHYNRARKTELTNLIGKAWLLDCVGLIKGYYWGSKPASNLVAYDLKTDLSANSMHFKAKIKGPINTMPEVPGICVHMNEHIGIYIGNGMVIEATRGVFGDGVVQTRLKDRKWLHWLECPYITYIKEEDKMPDAWKTTIMIEAAEKKLIDLNMGHKPDDTATKWFVLAVALNLLKVILKSR